MAVCMEKRLRVGSRTQVGHFEHLLGEHKGRLEWGHSSGGDKIWWDLLYASIEFVVALDVGCDIK